MVIDRVVGVFASFGKFVERFVFRGEASPTWNIRRSGIVCALLFVLALGIRLPYISIGLPYMHFWDESELARESAYMYENWTAKPQRPTYGSTHYYTLTGWYVFCQIFQWPLKFPYNIYHATNIVDVSQFQVNSSFIYYSGRLLQSCVVSLGIVLVYLLAIRCSCLAVALWAFFFLCMNYAEFIQSLHMNVHTFATVFCVAGLYCLQLSGDSKTPGKKYYLILLSGVFFGIGGGVNFFPLVASGLAVLFICRSRDLNLGILPPFTIVVLTFFLLSSPYLFLDRPLSSGDGLSLLGWVVINLESYAKMGGAMDFGMNIQSCLSYLCSFVFGWIMSVFMIFGLIRLLSTERLRQTVLLEIILLSFMAVWSLSRQSQLYHRHLALALPGCAILVALGIDWAIGWGIRVYRREDVFSGVGHLFGKWLDFRRFQPQLRYGCIVFIVVFIIVGVFNSSLALTANHTVVFSGYEETRTRAIRWILEMAETNPPKPVLVDSRLWREPSAVQADHPNVKLFDDRPTIVDYSKEKGLGYVVGFPKASFGAKLKPTREQIIKVFKRSPEQERLREAMQRIVGASQNIGKHSGMFYRPARYPTIDPEVVVVLLHGVG